MVGLQQALNADAVDVRDVIDGFAGAHDVLDRLPGFRRTASWGLDGADDEHPETSSTLRSPLRSL